MHTFEVRTRERNQFVDISRQVQEAVTAQGAKHGACIVYCPHTTAAITINENADPDVVHDMLLWFERTVPKEQQGFQHNEGNSDSHIKASLVGSSAMVLIEAGRLVLGRWQGVFFCEFDGPRTRQVHVQILA
ncbi:MAG: secondary thiamine-phosphate synthase enzyme YjbQ [Gemmataceae bacterium]